MRVVVVGANGFLGSHLVDHLVATGHRVTAVDRFSSSPRFSANPHQIITTDDPGGGALDGVLPGVDAVIDTLGASTPLRSAENPHFDEEVTLPRTSRLLHACSKANVGHYYFASTGGAIYGDSSRETNSEDDPVNPTSAYAVAKWETELTLDGLRESGDLASTVWRLSNPYGPRQNPASGQGFITIALSHHLSGAPVPVMGSGDMVRDYMFIDDAITRLAAFLGHPTPHHTYNIGSGVGVSVSDVLAIIAKVVGAPVKTTPVAIPPGFVHRSVVDPTRLVQEFGPKPLTPLEEGVEKTWAWLRSEN